MTGGRTAPASSTKELGGKPLPLSVTSGTHFGTPAALAFGSMVIWLSTFLTPLTLLVTLVATPLRPPFLSIPVKVTTPSLVDTLILASFREGVLESFSLTAVVMFASVTGATAGFGMACFEAAFAP